MPKKMEPPRSLKRKVAAKHLSNSKDTDIQMHEEFHNELKKIGGPSLWLTVVLVLMCSPSLCHIMLHTVFAKISTLDFETRCRIPQLENKNWSFEQLHHLSAPPDEKIRNCTYYLYNYNVIALMSYRQAVEYEKSIKTPDIGFCSKYVHKGSSVYSVYEEFSLVCKQTNLEEILNISPVYGKIVGSLVLVPWADLVGRKRVINWGADLFILGAAVISLARSVESLILGRVLVGMAYTTMIHPIEAVVIEISNVQFRPFRFIAVNMGIGLGFITIPLFATGIWHWRHVQWTVCTSLLILPLTTWYVPESPRWLMSKGRKAKAWSVLRTVKDPAMQSELLISYRNEKRCYTEEIKTHIKELRPFIISRLWFLMLLSFFVGAVYFKNLVVRFQMKLHTSRPIYFMLSGIAEILSYMFCMPLLLILGRRITMGFSFLCGGITYLVASQLETGSVESLISLLIIEISTGAAYATSLLYVAENVPTSHRCTAIGIANGLGAGLSTVIMFHTYYYLISYCVLFLALACICFLGLVVSFFAHESKKKSTYDTVGETTRLHTN